ncbi:MAG: hypothetical protein AAB592_01625, partial [Patescibacteria group bacterium]
DALHATLEHTSASAVVNTLAQEPELFADLHEKFVPYAMAQLEEAIAHSDRTAKNFDNILDDDEKLRLALLYSANALAAVQSVHMYALAKQSFETMPTMKHLNDTQRMALLKACLMYKIGIADMPADIHSYDEIKRGYEAESIRTLSSVYMGTILSEIGTDDEQKEERALLSRVMHAVSHHRNRKLTAEATLASQIMADHPQPAEDKVLNEFMKLANIYIESQHRGPGKHSASIQEVRDGLLKKADEGRHNMALVHDFLDVVAPDPELKKNKMYHESIMEAVRNVLARYPKIYESFTETGKGHSLTREETKAVVNAIINGSVTLLGGRKDIKVFDKAEEYLLSHPDTLRLLVLAVRNNDVEEFGALLQDVQNDLTRISAGVTPVQLRQKRTA